MDTSRLVQEVLIAARLGQGGLAHALSVSQPAVSQWLANRREPSAEVVERLTRACQEIPFTVRRGPWIQPIILPGIGWERPAFEPRGTFILPEHICWTGTRAQRTFDAANHDHLMYAYSLVIHHGDASDFARWIDLNQVRAHFDEIRWTRGWQPAWREMLEETATLDASV